MYIYEVLIWIHPSMLKITDRNKVTAYLPRGAGSEAVSHPVEQIVVWCYLFLGVLVLGSGTPFPGDTVVVMLASPNLSLMTEAIVLPEALAC